MASETTKKPLIKKLLLGAGGIVLLLLLLIVAIPFFVNVDSYRPKIIEVASQYMNGSLELGKLSLSLWGKVQVRVEKLGVKDASGKSIVAADDVAFVMPWLSVFTGSPSLTLKMVKPELSVQKNKAGKLNVLSLVKTAGPGEAGTPGASAAPSTPTKPMALPGIVVSSRLGVDLQNASLVYRDEMTDLTSKIEDLDVEIKDISLSRTSHFKVSAKIDTKMGSLMSVRGPATIEGEVKPATSGGKFQSAMISTVADVSGLEIDAASLFHKSNKIPAKATVKVDVGMEAVNLQSLEAIFHNLVLKGKGQAKGIGSANGPEMDFEFSAPKVALAPWSELIPMLKTYELGGSLSFDTKLSGTATVPQYTANLALTEVTAKAPGLKSPPRIDGVVKVITNQVEKMEVTVKGPGNDLKVNGRVVNFTAPQIDLVATSTGMDLDQWIDFPPPKSAKESQPTAPSGGQASSGAASPQPADDYDAMLKPLQKNAVAKATVLKAKANLAFIKAKGVKMTDIVADCGFKDLQFVINSFKMGLFKGGIGANAAFNMAVSPPTYRFGTNVQGLDIQDAVSSQFALFKNTLLGIASFKMDGSGVSINPDKAKLNLKSKGNLSVTHATFATIDIGRMVSEGINKSIGELSEKVPVLKGKSLGIPGNIESKYSSVSASFSIDGGKFSSPDFQAKAEPNKGLDIKGATEVGLVNYGLKADWEVIDTYNLTKARDLSVEQGGVKVDHILADGGNPVRLPIRIGGTVFAPEYHYGAIPEALGKVALSNVGRAAGEKLKSEAKKQAAEQAKKLTEGAPKPIQDALKGIFGN